MLGACFLLPGLPVGCEEQPAAARLAAARKRMVEHQLAGLGRGITNTHVLAVMGRVPRHEFVPAKWRDEAYEDTSGASAGRGELAALDIEACFLCRGASAWLEPNPECREGLKVGRHRA